MDSVLTNWINPFGDLHVCNACTYDCRLRVSKEYLHNLPKTCDRLSASAHGLFKIEGLLPDTSAD